MSCVPVRMRDARAALELPEVRQIFVDSMSQIEDLDAVEVMHWLLQHAHRDEVFVCLVRRDAEWVGYILAEYSPWTWSRDGSVLMVWAAKGAGKSVRAVIRGALAEWMRDSGIKRLVSLVRDGASWRATGRLWSGNGLHVAQGRDTVFVTLAEDSDGRKI